MILLYLWSVWLTRHNPERIPEHDAQEESQAVIHPPMIPPDGDQHRKLITVSFFRPMIRLYPQVEHHALRTCSKMGPGLLRAHCCSG